MMKTKEFIPGKLYQIEPRVTAEFVKETKRYLYFKGQQLYDAMFEESTLKGFEGLFAFCKGHGFKPIESEVKDALS